MRLFSNLRSRLAPPPVEPAPGPVTPLSRQRIADWFQSNEYHYFVDDEGDLGGLWNGRLFLFLATGPHHEILQVRGQWNRKLSILRLSEVLDVCNSWNQERIFPTCYVRVRDDGMIRVVAETSTDLEHGVTDDQLDQLLHCALVTSNRFLDEIDERYPDTAELPPID